jgi:hypothetical protein
VNHQGAPIEDVTPPGRRLSRGVRWGVPAVAVLAVGGVIAGTTAAGAQSAPVLPARSAAQLLTEVATSSGPGPMTGTIQETASLGLPALPSSDSPSSTYSLLSGTHTFNIWYADPAHVRVSEPVQLGESDLRIDGRQVWLWNSKTQTATHVVAGGRVPAVPGPLTFAEPLKPGFMPHVFTGHGRVCVVKPATGQGAPSKMCMKAPQSRIFARAAPPKALLKGGPPAPPVKVTKLADGKVRITFANGKTRTVKVPARTAVPQPLIRRHFGPPPTPQQAAHQILAALGPTTTVSVQRNVMVAGQAAYQISLAPKDSRSLVGRIQIAIDAAKHFPLRVQVFARGSASPAFQVGFTALTFGRPAASNFSFTPPAGAKVKKVSVPTGPLGFPLHLVLPPSGKDQSIAGGAWLPDGLPFITPPKVVGKGWLSVLEVQSSAAVGSSYVFSSPGPAGTKVTEVPQGSSAYSSSVTVVSNSPSGRAVSYQYADGASSLGPAQLGPLMRATTPVHGTWGSGRLLRTSLLDVLITSKGAVLAGAVQPSVLYADAAALSK